MHARHMHSFSPRVSFAATSTRFDRAECGEGRKEGLSAGQLKSEKDAASNSP